MRTLLWLVSALAVGCQREVVVRADQLPDELWMPKADGERTTQTVAGRVFACCSELVVSGQGATHRFPAGTGLRFVGDRVEVHVPQEDGFRLGVQQALPRAEVERVRLRELDGGLTAGVILAGFLGTMVLIAVMTMDDTMDGLGGGAWGSK